MAKVDAFDLDQIDKLLGILERKRVQKFTRDENGAVTIEFSPAAFHSEPLGVYVQAKDPVPTQDDDALDDDPTYDASEG